MRQTDRKPLPVIESLVFLSVLVIAGCHGLPLYAELAPTAQLVCRYVLEAANSWLFVLAGFAMHRHRCAGPSRSAALPSLLAIVCMRYLPLYALLVLLPVVGCTLLHYPEKSWGWLLSFATLTQSWFAYYPQGMLLPYHYHPLTVYLSTLPSGIFFMLMVYSLLLWRGCLGHRAVQRLGVLLYGTTLILAVAITDHQEFRSLFYNSFLGRVDEVWIFHLSPYGRLAEFFLGVMAAQWATERSRESGAAEHGVFISGATLSAYVLVYVTLVVGHGYVPWHMQLASPLVAALLSMSVRYPDCLRPLLRRLPKLTACVPFAYGVYLIHGDVMRYVAFLPELGVLEKLVTTLLVLVFGALALYRFYDRPVRSLLARKLPLWFRA